MEVTTLPSLMAEPSWNFDLIAACLDVKYCNIKIYYLQRSRASFVEDENIQKTIRKASFIAATSTAVNAVDDSKALLDEVIKSCHWLLPTCHCMLTNLVTNCCRLSLYCHLSLFVADLSLYCHRLVTVLSLIVTNLSPTVANLSLIVAESTVFLGTCRCIITDVSHIFAGMPLIVADL